jgi:hypothetical protein
MLRGRLMTSLWIVLTVKPGSGLDSNLFDILTHLSRGRLDLASQKHPFSDRRPYNRAKRPTYEWGSGFHGGDRRRSQNKHCRSRPDDMERHRHSPFDPVVSVPPGPIAPWFEAMGPKSILSAPDARTHLSAFYLLC